ncbi:MAG: 4-alpha-glucanotransferase [Phormidesmis sp.]
MAFPRTSGILLHPTSLPGRYGIGDLGAQAYRFVDFLIETQQTLWQILPLGPTGHGNSPYMCYSALAGNPLLINLENLQSQGLLTAEELTLTAPFSAVAVDYDAVGTFKLDALRKAAARFKKAADPSIEAEYKQFIKESSDWLEDYALFMAIKQINDNKPWSQWDADLAHRQTEAMNRIRLELSDEILFHEFMQFQFWRQWLELKNYANANGIQIGGDMPIYVAHDSADVWARPENFSLDQETLEPALMAGVPPDFFSVTGQLWGNPTYNWEAIEANGFDWWLQRLRALLRQVDLIRIDHFRGFEAFWAVEAGQETAINGRWIEAPGEAFFEKVSAELGELPFLAEDLGLIDEKVEALRDKFDFPGMKILLFAFGGGPNNPYLPFNVSSNFAIYTGTHDNNTTVGWFDHQATELEKYNLATYVGPFSAENVHWAMIRLALGSVANQAVVPLQDLMGLGSDARMNTPGVAEGNWEWRYSEAMITSQMKRGLKQLTEVYGRARDRPDEETAS